ncbi:SitI3 family protein [Actinoplanes sp. NPDC024001]|uniref:SitI3 family protein n=1 Tax=Actinoplanes sp. NPDC024001 TaxID=3154598 RepID=UPI003404F99A
MAIEYTLLCDADCGTTALRAFLTTEIEGDGCCGHTVFCHGMYVTVADGETPRDTAPFGFEHRATATFHFSDLADDATDERNTACMVRSVLDLVERYACHGVLLFNGELVIAQWTPAEVVFDRDWELWSTVDAVAGHPMRRLPQPLL